MTHEQFPPAEEPVTFAKPPVNEVVFAVQFVGGAIDLEVLGGIAARVKGQFPDRQQHPPLPPMTEDFEIGAQAAQVIFRTQPDLPRTWFVSEDGTRLIQAQADRFAYNWRRRSTDDAYPRYNGLRAEFIEHLEALMESVKVVNPAAAAINFCELSYVNELALPDVQPKGPHPQLSRFLRFVEPIVGSEFLPEAEDARLQARWRIISDGGDPRGRLYAAADPVYRPTDELPIYLHAMTARMVAEDADVAAAIDLLDLGHTWVVKGFKDLTTKEMHEIWELQEAT